jgi:dolichol-phosphate mannosyltransferase
MVEPLEVSLVLPTYNERESLDQIHGRIDRALAVYRHEVIVVDDSSPDGTADYARELGRDAPYRVISRPSRSGLSSAVLDGCRAATGTVVAVMDADGSHPPERLPDLIGPIRAGKAEFCLGSRRVPGGSEEGLSAIRRLISTLATLPARPLTPVHDPMSGFFAVRKIVLDRGDLNPTGFKIALEVLVKCRPHPVREIPFQFGKRVAGESKLGPNTIALYWRHVARLYRWRFVGPGAASRTR